MRKALLIVIISIVALVALFYLGVLITAYI